MPTIQFITEREIKALMVKHGVLPIIRAGELTRKQKHLRPAKSLPGGESIIYNYYDKGGGYVATAHKLINASGQAAHCDAKRFLIGSNDYRIPLEPTPRT